MPDLHPTGALEKLRLALPNAFAFAWEILRELSKRIATLPKNDPKCRELAELRK
jgi:hypothetical protein